MNRFLFILAAGAIGFYLLQDQGIVQVRSNSGGGSGAFGNYTGSTQPIVGGVVGAVGG